MIAVRLLMVASNFPPVLGGIQRYAHELALCLAARGCELLVVTPRAAGWRAYDEESALTILRLPAIADDMALSGIAPLAYLLRRQPFDAAFATHWAPGFALQQAARIVGRSLPVFVAAHGKELIHHPLAKLPIAQAVYDRIRASVLTGADGFFPVSERTAELLRAAGTRADRITVVHNGVDAQHFQPRDASALRNTLAPSGPLILSVARLVRRKGIDTVLHALPAVIARLPHVTYAIVGEGPDHARLTALAAKLGVTQHVRFLPSVTHGLVDYYNACDLFVMPAREEAEDIEGFGLVFLEAGACEKPVIGARAGGVVDAIVDGVTGFLLPPDDVDALGRAITELLSDRERAVAMGRAARARILREGSWQDAAHKILSAIQAKRDGLGSPVAIE